MSTLSCCNTEPKLLHNIYGYWYLCSTCGSSIGTHKGTTNPLGKVLADRELKDLRIEAHSKFDPLWLNNKNRRQARRLLYEKLATSLNMPVIECHFSNMDKATIRQALLVINEFKGD